MANVTIKDVARAASVSVATVSRVLNGHDNVTEHVRDRVLSVARELRYTPHAAARSLSSRRTQALGVVLPDLHGEFFSELIRGIDQVARRHRLHLLLSSYHGDVEEQGTALQAMRGRVDGLLVMSPYTAASQSLEDARSLSQLPVVLINSQSGGAAGTVLGVDNHGGARVMVEHLVSGGHRRIAFIAGPEDNFDAHERLRGYRDALAELLPDTAEWILRGDFDEASGHRAGRELIAASERPDAVFAANDMMALGCMFAFLQAGIDVPGEIALAGFDDIPLAGYVHPGLSTMRVNIAELGSHATELLVAAIASKEPVTEPRRWLATELIVRESSGPPGRRTSS
ncbi:LacI family DNA-binding transcriptional regulator [Lysobacter maris]|uniref:LacI family DNA-binding transcriptional regulator n=1 Tax=Marilutibacter maris TaxID=1605891 RepID=A0A507ZT66_9GAMM|nr:LacI family DNA-binding transcriptional regulator [Lysobacter maris]KAB8163156.1 LacI family DNA-binding transcriptional regulator [Lysobacter maris]